MAANEKLIQSMLKCDGTRKNCERCVFREHPDCRNAMAHHAGALIQLQDVVVENSGAIQRKVLEERHAAQVALSRETEAREEIREAYLKLLIHLRERKDCGSCAVKAGTADLPEEDCESICKECQGGETSLWAFNEEIVKVSPCEKCEREDCEDCEHCQGGEDDDDEVKRID